MNRKSKIIIYIFILLSLIGCKSKEHNKEVLKKKDLAPKSLRELNKEIASIMDYIGDIEKIDLEIELDDEKKDEKDKLQEDSKKDETDGDKGEQSSKNEEEQISTQDVKKDSKENTKDKAGKEEIKHEEIEAKWKKADKMLEKVYKSWNSYQIKAVKRGSTIENGDEVEDSLNKLTKAIEDREMLSAYNYGSGAFKALKPFYELYTDEIGGEIASLKYKVYQFHINAIKNSKNTALAYISGSEEDINKIKYKLEKRKDKKQDLDKVDLGFKNLSNTLNEESRRLFILKKDTLIENLNSLEN